MKNIFDDGNNNAAFNPNQYMDINAVFDYENCTPSGNDKNEKENKILLNNKDNDNKTIPNIQNKTMDNNKNINNNNSNDRNSIPINPIENKKKIFEKINEQTIFPSNDDDSSDDLLNCSNNNFIVSIIRDLQGDSDKRDISILEDDYITPKIFRFVQIDNIKKILEHANKNKNKMLELKNSIDNYKITGRNLALISSLENLLKRNYDMNNKNMRNVLENLNIYENIIFKWRATKGDKDCFYRSVMFYFLENIILEKNIQYFVNFFYDVYTCTQEEFFIKILENYKINIENLILVFVLIYYALSLNDVKNSIIKSYSILIKVFNNVPDFDFGIILYLKYSIYKYIQLNENKLYTKDFSVNLNNLLPEKYQIDGKFLYKEFYEKDLIPLNKDTERIIIYITPFVLGKTIKIYSFDFMTKDSNTLREIPFDAYSNYINKDNPDKNEICLLFRDSHYDIIYPKIYFEKFKNYLTFFSEVDKPQLNNNIINSPAFNSMPPINKNHLQNDFNNNNMNNIHNNNLNINNNFQKAISSDIPNKILPSQISRMTGFEEEEKKDIFFCPLCNVEVKKNFYCEKCNISILKNWLNSSYCNYIKYNIANLITMKQISNFKEFLKKYSLINYPNKQKISFEEGNSYLLNKINIEMQIKTIKNNLCLGCFKFFQINQNTFFFQLPCKCIFCSIDCLKKFINAIPFDKMNFYICACGEQYDLIKLKYFVSFLSSHNLIKAKNDFIRYIYNTMKNKCAKCNNIINIQNNQINIIEVNDIEAERIFNINKFNHLICDNCWKNVGNDNSKFICETCNSIHFMNRKFTYKNGNIRENCSIF